MIIERQISPTRVKHYSDIVMMIRQAETGVLYEDAVDTIPCRYTYEETDEPIPPSTEDATPEDYTNALAEMGVPV